MYTHTHTDAVSVPVPLPAFVSVSVCACVFVCVCVRACAYIELFHAVIDLSCDCSFYTCKHADVDAHGERLPTQTCKLLASPVPKTLNLKLKPYLKVHGTW